MKIEKILIIALLTMVILAFATIITYKMKPQMHKTVQLESIIFKRAIK